MAACDSRGDRGRNSRGGEGGEEEERKKEDKEKEEKEGGAEPSAFQRRPDCLVLSLTVF